MTRRLPSRQGIEQNPLIVLLHSCFLHRVFLVKLNCWWNCKAHMQTVGREKSLENTIVRIYEKICKWQWVFFFSVLLLVETEFHPQKQLAKSFEPNESLTWLTYCSHLILTESHPKLAFFRWQNGDDFEHPLLRSKWCKRFSKRVEKGKMMEMDKLLLQDSVTRSLFTLFNPCPPSSLELNATTNLCTLSLFFQKLKRGK